MPNDRQPYFQMSPVVRRDGKRVVHAIAVNRKPRLEPFRRPRWAHDWETICGVRTNIVSAQSWNEDVMQACPNCTELMRAIEYGASAPRRVVWTG